MDHFAAKQRLDCWLKELSAGHRNSAMSWLDGSALNELSKHLYASRGSVDNFILTRAGVEYLALRDYVLKLEHDLGIKMQREQ